LSDAPIAHTRDGAVRGVHRNGVEVYRGIPYATADRFAAPVAAPPWADVLDATAFGPIAPQVPGAQFQSADLVQDEQCLSVNVWTPGPSGARPVMVWIHGGAFRTGSGASPLYEGSTLATRGDVVVMTLNYRLGALGYLAHPDLATDDQPIGNWGMLDQVEALRWVRDNAAAFGGDPDDVTIFGESAGAAAVSLLCAMPSAAGLFHKAIVQSGAPLTSKRTTAERLAEHLAEVVGVTDVAALREVPLADLLAGQQRIEAEGADRTFIPTVDGAVIPTLPGLAIHEGSAGGIPMLVGSNVDEWKLWAPADPHSRDLDEDRLRSRLERTFPAEALDGLIDGFREARLARGESDASNEVFYAVETERTFRVPGLRLADAQTDHAPTFVYLFAWGSPAMGGWLGSCHGLEIAFAFGNQGRGELAAFTGAGPDADGLAERMMDAWLAFARTGDPSTPELPWPRHDPETRPTMVFDAASRVEPAPRDEERAVMDALLPWPKALVS
jgi:para-nitrobenzyl esterase